MSQKFFKNCIGGLFEHHSVFLRFFPNRFGCYPGELADFSVLRSVKVLLLSNIVRLCCVRFGGCSFDMCL